MILSIAFREINCGTPVEEMEARMLQQYLSRVKVISPFDLQQLRVAPIELARSIESLTPKPGFKNIRGDYNRKVIQRYLLGAIFSNRISNVQNISTHLVCIQNKTRPLQGIFTPTDAKVEHFWILVDSNGAVRANVKYFKDNQRVSLCRSLALVCNGSLSERNGKFHYHAFQNILDIDDSDLDGYNVYAYSSRDKDKFKHDVFLIKDASHPQCKEQLSRSSSNSPLMLLNWTLNIIGSMLIFLLFACV